VDSVGEFVIRKKARGEIIKQEIYLEPIDSNILFAADAPMAFMFREPNSLRLDFLARLVAIVEHEGDYWSFPFSPHFEIESATGHSPMSTNQLPKHFAHNPITYRST
jgi:hypothetical protein